jgi:hypothetical protein
VVYQQLCHVDHQQERPFRFEKLAAGYSGVVRPVCDRETMRPSCGHRWRSGGQKDWQLGWLFGLPPSRVTSPLLLVLAEALGNVLQCGRALA